MHLKVDQGITKIGNTKGPTYFAFSNKEQHIIVIPAGAKREIVTWLRQKKKFKPASYYQLFAAGLFLLLKNHLEKATNISVDDEYQGHDGEIKGILLNYIQRFTSLDPAEIADKIDIVPLPKRNPADRLIHQVHKQQLSHPLPRVIHTNQLQNFFS